MTPIAKQQTQSNVVPTALFAGLGIISAVGAGSFGLETYLLAKRKPPITWYTRNQVSWHAGIAGFACFVAGLAAGAALTHFVADEVA